MADCLLAREVSDLCLGKPALRSISSSATVAQALLALRRLGDSYVSVWSCDHRRIKSPDVGSECRCVGKVCMVDVVCFLAREENLKNPAIALQKPLSILLEGVLPLGIVRHLEPHASLLEAIDVILEGAQNLVIPIQSRFSPRKKLTQRNSVNSTLHNDGEYCWLTQEDVIRYLLNCIGFFSPLPSQTVESLDIIDRESVLAVRYDDPAESALPLISQSLAKQTSVAILDDEGRLVGEISPAALNYCDESVAAAVATLSAGDLMTYVDCYSDPPEELVQLVKERLEAKNLAAAVELIDEDSSGLSSASSMSSCSSSDEEFGGRSANWHSPKVVRNTEDVVCYPWSSLVAVMIQTLSHRTGYIWVVEEDGCLAGVVTYAAMTRVFRERLKSMTW
ncbi:CBS domain-containing protein CBSX5 [Linum grandiflorum]